MIYPLLKRHKIFGFNLKPHIEINSNKQINSDRAFKHYLRKDIIKFQSDSVGFLKPINEYKNSDGTFLFLEALQLLVPKSINKIVGLNLL